MVVELSVERSEWLTVLRINRPERSNALNANVVEAMLEALSVAASDGTRLLVIRGNGKGFCSGFDLTSLEDESDADLTLRFVRIEQLLQAVAHFPVETVALAQGRVFGAGADLFCACNHRICAPGASFRFPGVRFGVVLGTRRLAGRIGDSTASTTILHGRELGAGEAVSCGLATEELAESEWDHVTEKLLDETRRNSRVTAGAILRATRPDTRAADMAALVESVAAPGLKERIRAYRDQAMVRNERKKKE